MITISTAKGVGSTKQYHREELATGDTEIDKDRQIGEWHGRLAADMGLTGQVHQIHFDRLAEGKHPITCEQLVRDATPRQHTTKAGSIRTSMSHRSSWEISISAPKSVSLTAILGGDHRVQQAHLAAASVAINTLERSMQAHSTSGKIPEMTGAWISARFSHTHARPVAGYAAPQLHEHLTIFNMTAKANGQIRGIDPKQIFKDQAFATGIYRTELTRSLKTLGYEITRGEHGEPQIVGYSVEHLRAESPRRVQLEESADRSPYAVYAREDKRAAATASAPRPAQAVAVALVEQVKSQTISHRTAASVETAVTRAAQMRPFTPTRAQVQAAAVALAAMRPPTPAPVQQAPAAPDKRRGWGIVGAHHHGGGSVPQPGRHIGIDR